MAGIVVLNRAGHPQGPVQRTDRHLGARHMEGADGIRAKQNHALRFAGARGKGCEIHQANRTPARLRQTNLRMHGTGIDPAGGFRERPGPGMRVATGQPATGRGQGGDEDDKKEMDSFHGTS